MTAGGLGEYLKPFLRPRMMVLLMFCVQLKRKVVGLRVCWMRRSLWFLRSMVTLLPWVRQRPFCVLPVVYVIGLRCGWSIENIGSFHGFLTLYTGLGEEGGGIVVRFAEAWYTALDMEEVLSGAVDGDVSMFVAGVVKSF